MKMLKKISTSLVVFFLIVLPIFGNAQTTRTTNPAGTTRTTDPSSVSNIRIPNPLNCGTDANPCTFMSLLALILDNIIMPIAAVAVVIYIVWAGFRYVTAQGNPTKIEEAHQRLLWALIGAGILLGASGISKVVEKTIKSVLPPGSL